MYPSRHVRTPKMKDSSVGGNKNISDLGSTLIVDTRNESYNDALSNDGFQEVSR